MLHSRLPRQRQNRDEHTICEDSRAGEPHSRTKTEKEKRKKKEIKSVADWKRRAPPHGSGTSVYHGRDLEFASVPGTGTFGAHEFGPVSGEACCGTKYWRRFSFYFVVFLFSFSFGFFATRSGVFANEQLSGIDNRGLAPPRDMGEENETTTRTRIWARRERGKETGDGGCHADRRRVERNVEREWIHFHGGRPLRRWPEGGVAAWRLVRRVRPVSFEE